jgi:hypothetical protein
MTISHQMRQYESQVRPLIGLRPGTFNYWAD